MNFIIQNCYLVASSAGIFIDTVSDNTVEIKNNILFQNLWGIRIGDTNHVNITDNLCDDNSDGMYIHDSEYVYLRIYLDIGEYDYGIPNIRKLHEDLEAAGRAHTWLVNEAGNHSDAYWADHVEDYVRWYGQGWPLAPTAYPKCQLAPGS